MRLLVAGWHGLVARALIEAAPNSARVKAMSAGRAALDVRDPRSIERAFGDLSPDIVINSAAYTAVDKAEQDREAVFAMNRDGAALLARAAARHGVPIIHLSTHYVFDGTKSSPYDEADPPTPVTVYGHSKYEGERAVAEANPHHLILRTGWVFSPAANGFAARMMANAAGEEPLRVVSDQRGNPTYAPHLANALLEIAHQLTNEPAPSPAWGTYHLAGTGETSWYGLAVQLLTRGAGAGSAGPRVEPIASSDYPTIAPRPANATLACGKFERAFGIRLPDWQQGAADCAAELGAR